MPEALEPHPVSLEQPKLPDKARPRIEYFSTPEKHNLPYAVHINPVKLSDFLTTIGFSDAEIAKTSITVAYDYKPLSKAIRKVLPVAGSVNPISGDAIIYPVTLFKHAQFTYKRFLQELSGQTGPEVANAEQAGQQFVRFLLGQVLPELSQKGQSDSLKRVSPLERSAYAQRARTLGEEEQAKEFMKQYLEDMIQQNLQLIVPHELIHTKQVHRGLLYKQLGIGVTAALTMMMAEGALALGIRRIANNQKIPLGPRTRGALHILGFFSGLALFTKIAYYGRKLIGHEKEAYETMKLYADQFKDIVTITPTGIPLDAQQVSVQSYSLRGKERVNS